MKARLLPLMLLLMAICGSIPAAEDHLAEFGLEADSCGNTIQHAILAGLVKPLAAVQVIAVTPGTAAADAGLRAGDVVTAISGYAMTGMGRLCRLFHYLKPNKTITLTIYRGPILLSLVAVSPGWRTSDASTHYDDTMAAFDRALSFPSRTAASQSGQLVGPGTGRFLKWLEASRSQKE